MTAMMTVQQLASEVKRQQQFKRDFVARPWEGFRMHEDGQLLSVGDLAEFPIGRYAHGDLAEFTEIPRAYYDKMLKDEPELRPAPGVIFIKSVDGLGPVASKIKTYDYLTQSMASSVHPGFKLFFDEDTRNGSRLMTPKEVLALSPKPEYVMYE